MIEKKYKYDAVIFLPINTDNAQRIELFDEIGIINCIKSKIKICFLTGTQIKSQEDLNNLFPIIASNSNIDLCYLYCSRNHPAAKVYDFYMKKEQYDDSKWIIKIDDDTSTDIDKTLNFLLYHDQEKNYVFLSNFCSGEITLTKIILEKNNLYEKIKFSDTSSFSNNFNAGDSYNLQHEHEILIVSNAVINKIVEKYGEIILDRSTVQEGYTDQLFFNLCKVEGIHGTKIKLLDSQGDLTDYLAGRSSHIHNISYEKQPKMATVRRFIKHKIKPYETVLAEKTYLLNIKVERTTPWNRGTELRTSLIKFGKNGQVESDHFNPSIRYWYHDKENKKLKLINEHFKTTSVFDVLDESNVEFLQQPKCESEQSPPEHKEFVTSFLILQKD